MVWKLVVYGPGYDMFPAFVSLQMISLLSRSMWSLCTVNSISSLLTFASEFVKWWPTVFCLHADSPTRFTFANETKRALYNAYASLYSFSHGTINSHTRMYTPFFKPLIRRKKLGNWPNLLRKDFRTLANRQEVGEKAVNGISTLNMIFIVLVWHSQTSLRYLAGPSILFTLRCAAIIDYILEACLQQFLTPS